MGVTWSWERALVGAAYAVPAAAVTLRDPATGIPLAVGVLPAAIIPMPPRRRGRIVILAIGVLAGAALFLGGVLAHLPSPVAALLLWAAVIGAAATSSLRPVGNLVLVLCAPLVGAGMSYDDYGSSAATFALLSAGAAYAWLVSLLWPDRDAPPRTPPALPPLRTMLGYGARMGFAAAVAYLVASALALDHPGWAPAACLLVARPQVDLLQIRGVGRVLSVAAGATLAALVLDADPPNATYAVLVVGVLGAAAATVGSRWYITSAFTTFFVFLMLLRGTTGETAAKFNERVGETLLGVALAFLFAWAVPSLLARRGRDGPED